jgi:hypothetical protein
MKIRNVTVEQMEQALAAANKDYNGNLCWNRFEPKGKSINFTLRVKSSHALGARISFSGRHIPSACWHAHRDFMREVFELAPDAVLTSCRAQYEGKAGFEANYPKTGAINIGSMMQPMSFASACEC